jgi:hypothetical protein
MDDCCHRMLVGGPRDGQIVWVHKIMPPFQVPVPESLKLDYGPGPVSDKLPKAMLVQKIGWYYRDEYLDNTLGLNQGHTYYRWEEWSKRLAAKVYMRRSGKSLYDIYHHVEWMTWGE